MENTTKDRMLDKALVMFANNVYKGTNLRDLAVRGLSKSVLYKHYESNTDGSVSNDYCKYCCMNGEFVDKVTMGEYIEMCILFGEQAGMTNEEMKAYCEKLFPTLKRWKEE